MVLYKNQESLVDILEIRSLISTIAPFVPQGHSHLSRLGSRVRITCGSF